MAGEMLDGLATELRADIADAEGRVEAASKKLELVQAAADRILPVVVEVEEMELERLYVLAAAIHERIQRMKREDPQRPTNGAGGTYRLLVGEVYSEWLEARAQQHHGDDETRMVLNRQVGEKVF